MRDGRCPRECALIKAPVVVCVAYAYTKFHCGPIAPGRHGYSCTIVDGTPDASGISGDHRTGERQHGKLRKLHCAVVRKRGRVVARDNYERQILWGKNLLSSAQQCRSQHETTGDRTARSNVVDCGWRGDLQKRHNAGVPWATLRTIVPGFCPESR